MLVISPSHTKSGPLRLLLPVGDGIKSSELLSSGEILCSPFNVNKLLPVLLSWYQLNCDSFPLISWWAPTQRWMRSRAKTGH